MFDELISAEAFPHLIRAGHILLDKSGKKKQTLCYCPCLFLFPLCLPDRNVGSRGGPGSIANFNRSTEDLHLKQQSANYGRLRKCLSMGALFVVSTYMHGCALWPCVKVKQYLVRFLLKRQGLFCFLKADTDLFKVNKYKKKIIMSLVGQKNWNCKTN